MTELDILKYVVDTGTKFGLSAASLMYLICMVVFPIYGFKYLTKRDLEEKIEREKNEKEREGLQQKVIGLIETNKNYIFDVVEKFNRDGEAKRKVYADMLQIQLETASKMMETISQHNLAAHKILSDRLGVLETRFEDISTSIKDISKILSAQNKDK